MNNMRTLDIENNICIEFDAVSSNEALARVVIASFITVLNPTLDEIEDIKTAISEAVTNAIVHGYGRDYFKLSGNKEKGKVTLKASIDNDGLLSVDVCDCGVGIKDVEEAMKPSFTSDDTGERSGMGFAFMQAFMDEVKVDSVPGQGTVVHMSKQMEYHRTKIDILRTNTIRDNTSQTDTSRIDTSLQLALWNSDGRI